MNQWISKSTMNGPMIQRIGDTLIQWTDEPMNQLINEWMNRWNIESMKHWNNELMNQCTNGSKNQWINESMSQCTFPTSSKSAPIPSFFCDFDTKAYSLKCKSSSGYSIVHILPTYQERSDPFRFSTVWNANLVSCAFCRPRLPKVLGACPFFNIVPVPAETGTLLRRP